MHILPRRAYTLFTQNERQLLYSFLAFAFAVPIFGTFMNTFLWRGAESPVGFYIFAAGMFAAHPLGFIFNLHTLRTISFKKSFVASCVLQGFAPLLLTIFQPASVVVIFGLGLLYGFPVGMYWSNRHIITLRATRNKRRMAFLSMNGVQDTLVGIIAPLLIGVTLAYWSFAIRSAYIGIVLVGFFLLILSGVLFAKTTLKIPKLNVKSMLFQNADKAWNRLRAFEILDGMITAGESLVALTLILTFIGLEDAVGGVRSGVAIIAASVLYVVGKRLRVKDYSKVLAVSLLMILFGAGVFAIRFDAFGAIVFFLCIGLVAGLRGTVFISTVYTAIDQQIARKKGSRFVLVLDREIFLNLGRVMVIFLLVICHQTHPTLTIRLSLLLLSLLHVPMLFLSSNMLSEHRA